MFLQIRKSFLLFRSGIAFLRRSGIAFLRWSGIAFLRRGGVAFLRWGDNWRSHVRGRIRGSHRGSWLYYGLVVTANDRQSQNKQANTQILHVSTLLKTKTKNSCLTHRAEHLPRSTDPQTAQFIPIIHRAIALGVRWHVRVPMLHTWGNMEMLLLSQSMTTQQVDNQFTDARMLPRTACLFRCASLFDNLVGWF